LHLRVDRVAIERGCERDAVFEELLGGEAAAGGGAARDALRARGHWREGAAGRACGRERRPKIDVTRLIPWGIGIGEVGGEHLRPLRIHLEGIGLDAEIGVEVERHVGIPAVYGPGRIWSKTHAKLPAGRGCRRRGVEGVLECESGHIRAAEVCRVAALRLPRTAAAGAVACG